MASSEVHDENMPNLLRSATVLVDEVSSVLCIDSGDMLEVGAVVVIMATPWSAVGRP